MPQRVYAEWTTWGEFLGTNNVFQKYEVGNYRPYWEAVRWAQALCIKEGLTRSLDWLHYYDAHESEIPSDIPKNAHYHYKKDWMGWATWLGTNIEGRLSNVRSDIEVFGLCTQVWTASNVIRVVMGMDGLEVFRSKVSDDQLGVLRVYRFERELASRMQGILNQFGAYQSDGTFIVRDMNVLLYEFDEMCERIEY